MSNSSQIDADFVNFIVEKVKDIKSPMILIELCREFTKNGGHYLPEPILIKRLQAVRDKMSEMENFDTEIKVKIIFALGAPVSNGFLNELKKQADVELDEQHRIIKYKQHGEGLQLNGVHIVRGNLCNMEADERMLKFLAERSESATSPMSDYAFLDEFCFSEGHFERKSCSKNRYHLLKRRIYLAPEFDLETKIKMLFVSNTKVHASILEELRKNAVVEVDKLQRITKYEANNGSLKLEGDRKKIKKLSGWTKEETQKLQNFVADRSKETKVPLPVNTFSKEFAEKNGHTMTTVRPQIYNYLLPNISKLEHFDRETRMRMLYALSAPVDREFLKELRKKAVVEVDEHQRIIKYKANNGSLKLETKRPPPSKAWSKEEKDKILKFIVEKSKMTNVPLLLEHLSKEFAEKNDISRTEHAVRDYIRIHFLPKISKLNDIDMETRMKMMFALSVPVDKGLLNESKKQYSNYDVDERVKNQKRKIVENSSDATSSFSKSRKYGRDADTQNKTESDQIAGETKQNDDREVVYDGPGEPPRPVQLPIKQEPMSYEEVKLEDEEVKLENEEYKPDISFLSNTTQNYMQNFAGTEGIHTDNVEQSTGNTEEMTSGKEIMKSLDCLLHALDSPILVKLQSKTEKAIKELGDGDHKIPTDEVIMTLNTGLIILNKKATMKPPTGEFTSLRDLFLILLSTLSIFRTSAFNNFQLKLKENIEKLDGHDKVILHDSIETVLGNVLLLVSP